MASLCTSRGSLRASYLNHDHCQAAAASRLPTVSVSLVFFPGLKKLQICSIPGRSNNSPDFNAAVLPCKKISFGLRTSHSDNLVFYYSVLFFIFGLQSAKRAEEEGITPELFEYIYYYFYVTDCSHFLQTTFAHISSGLMYHILCPHWSNELVF